MLYCMVIFTQCLGKKQSQICAINSFSQSVAVTDPVVKYFDKSHMPVHFYIVLVLNIIIYLTLVLFINRKSVKLNVLSTSRKNRMMCQMLWRYISLPVNLKRFNISTNILYIMSMLQSLYLPAQRCQAAVDSISHFSY